LRDFVEKIVKAKLGMNSPLIMCGVALLYEVGDDLEEDMIANYTANLEKVFLALFLEMVWLKFKLIWFSISIFSLSFPLGII